MVGGGSSGKEDDHGRGGGEGGDGEGGCHVAAFAGLTGWARGGGDDGVLVGLVLSGELSQAIEDVLDLIDDIAAGGRVVRGEEVGATAGVVSGLYADYLWSESKR